MPVSQAVSTTKNTDTSRAVWYKRGLYGSWSISLSHKRSSLTFKRKVLGVLMSRCQCQLSVAVGCETPEHVGRLERTVRSTCIRVPGQLDYDLCTPAVHLLLFSLSSRDAIIVSPSQAHALTTPALSVTDHVFVVAPSGPAFAFVNLCSWAVCRSQLRSCRVEAQQCKL